MWFRVVLFTGALSASAGCDCNGGGFPADARLVDAPAARGTVSLAWSLTDLTGRAITCDEVGASFVSLELRRQASLQGAVASFSCANSPSTSQAIEVGTYEVRFELRGQVLTPVAAQPQSSVVITKDQNTELAPVTFAVDTNGMLVLALVAPPFTSNCKPGSMQGAGITTNTITLTRAGGGCAPVTFVRTRGSTPRGTYTVNCSSPEISTCIENDETLTVPSMPSGPYQIHVRGKLSAVECWANDDSLQVPAQGKARTETLNLAFQAGTPGC
jgi:hypothetical protein